MKTAVIFIGLLVVVAIPANGQENKFMKKVVEAIKSCATEQHATDETLKAMMSMQIPHDKKVSALIHCTFEKLGVMSKGKINVKTAADDISESHQFDAQSKDALTKLIQLCKDEAEKGSSDPVTVAGKFADCVKKALVH